MGLSREPYGCVRLHDSACLLISENILQSMSVVYRTLNISSLKFLIPIMKLSSQSKRDTVERRRERENG